VTHVTFVLAWIAFPLVLAALGLGWGALVQDLVGEPLAGALLVPLGLAAAIVAATLLTTNGTTAPLAVPLVAVVAAAGLVRARTTCAARWRGGAAGWPLLAALGLLLAYGAPVLATGTATFTGFHKLDDTSTWFALTSHLFAHGRSTAGLPPSTYKLLLDSYLGGGAYPVGGFMLLGIGRTLARVDVAWAFQPYLACTGAALGLSIHALLEPIAASPRIRAGLAFVAAQPALLYGFSLWGGIKEMTAAFLLALVVALTAQLIRRPDFRPRAVLALAIATAALIVTFGPGTAVWVVPALGLLAVAWIAATARRERTLRSMTGSLGLLTTVSLVLSLPAWILLAQSLRTGSDFVGPAAAASPAISLGNLRAPLRAFQLAGIWPVGDFRNPLRTGPLVLLMIGLVIGLGLYALWASARSGRFGLALYVTVTLAACLAILILGGVPWVLGKALAIASPAILLAGLAGGAMLWARSRPAGGVALALIAGGVLWSNALAFQDVTIAPLGSLQDLAKIGTLVAGRGPTFVNDYEIYADRYFLRAGDPSEPADDVGVASLRNGVVLLKPAAADLDSYGLATILPYQSIVLPRSLVGSRPPSVYRLRWQGNFYELWQRAPLPDVHILSHVPLGESNQTPYCGLAQDGLQGFERPPQQLCSMQPVAPAPCAQVRSLASFALRSHGQLVAAERPPISFALADSLHPPRAWLVSPTLHQIAPTTPGRVSLQISMDPKQPVALWLGGSFGRGFTVSLDGRPIGRIRNERSSINGYVRVAALPALAGVHTVGVAYPNAGIGPGTADAQLKTALSSVVLEPLTPVSRLTTIDPRRAGSLCGRSLDWIEVVAPAPAR